MAVGVTSSFAYLAWSFREGTSLSRQVPKASGRFYGLAALLTFGIVPFTLIFMARTNNALSAKAAEALRDQPGSESTTLGDHEFSELLKRWNNYNICRSCLPLLATITALVTALV